MNIHRILLPSLVTLCLLPLSACSQDASDSGSQAANQTTTATAPETSIETSIDQSNSGSNSAADSTKLEIAINNNGNNQSADSTAEASSRSAKEDPTKEDKVSFNVKVATALQAAVDADESKWSKASTSAYSERNYQPIWFRHNQGWFADENEYKASKTTKEFSQILAKAKQHGFPDNYFGNINLPKNSQSMTPEQIAAQDLTLTHEFLAFAQDLSFGRVDTKLVGLDWRIPRESFPAKAILQQVADGDIDEILDSLLPTHPYYQVLVDARQDLLAKQKSSNDMQASWPRIPDTALVKPGEQHPVVVTLKQRLMASKHLADDHLPTLPDYETALQQELENAGITEADNSPEKVKRKEAIKADLKQQIAQIKNDRETLDSATAAALEDFQAEHNLGTDSILGGRTRAALNQSPADLLRKIDLNLERLRWFPRDLGDDHVLVNIAEFKLHFIKNGEEQFAMPVIVGETQNKTPIFSDRMEYVEINPYWNVPSSITQGELLPKIIRNPNYLREKRFEIVDGYGDNAPIINPNNINWNEYADGGWFPYRLRQQTGEGNALGRIKFMFPNEYNVYLHDTPTDHLFDDPKRTYSHGCVRVEDPVKFGSAIMGWSEARVQAAIDAEDRKTVSLANKLPVYLVYLTAWSVNGSVRYAPDIYEHDRKLEALLNNQARKFAVK